MTIVLVNAAWVIGSVAILLIGALPLTMLGIAFVIAQAVAVAALAALQWMGLGRTGALAWIQHISGIRMAPRHMLAGPFALLLTGSVSTSA